MGLMGFVESYSYGIRALIVTKCLVATAFDGQTFQSASMYCTSTHALHSNDIYPTSCIRAQDLGIAWCRYPSWLGSSAPRINGTVFLRAWSACSCQSDMQAWLCFWH